MKRTTKAGKGKHLPKERAKSGPKSLFNDTTCERAYRLCILGLKDTDLALAFGVSIQTIDTWKRNNPEFQRALQMGKQEADANVAMSLYKRAIGYQEDDVHISMWRGTIIVTPIKKNIAPDVTAQIYWLKNRQREIWADRQTMEHSGTINVTTQTDLSDLDETELNALQKYVGVKTNIPKLDFSHVSSN